MEYKSKLIFKKYIVDKVEFETNNEYNSEQKTRIDFSIQKSSEIKDNNMKITLVTKIFENAKEQNYPFEMKVEVTGYFQIEDNIEKIDYEPNAIAILYPYIRSIVSTYTAAANINPLILPAININKLIEQNKN